MEDNNWGIFKDKKIGNIFHVYPMNEEHSQEIIIELPARLHSPKSTCKCKPKVKWNEVKGTWIVLHGAFDGREALEEVNEILNPKTE